MPAIKDPLAEEMGKRVQAAMDSLGLTQVEVAKAVDMDPSTFGGAVRGYHRFQLDVLVRLPGILHRSLEYFFGLPEPRGLSEDQQELLSIYDSYRTSAMKLALREDALRHLEVERRILGVNSQ